MRFFDLSDDVTIPGRWHLGDVRTSQGHEPRLRAGLRWQGLDRLETTVDEPGRELDFCLTSFGVPVARTSLAAAIEAIAKSDVQRLPLSIPDHDGFEVVNVLRVVKCLDERLSEYMKWTLSDHRADLAGQYRMVTRLQILSDAIPTDAHVFRIEGWRIAVVVSEHVKVAMEAAGSLGAKFVEVPD